MVSLNLTRLSGIFKYMNWKMIGISIDDSMIIYGTMWFLYWSNPQNAFYSDNVAIDP